MPKKPGFDEYQRVASAYDEASDAEASGVAGKHAILVATLQKLGYAVYSTSEAFRIAIKILDEGWRLDDE
jgi:hypothetical protein